MNPIQFNIPTLKWNIYKSFRNNSKKYDISPMIPGKPSTYIYNNEKEYIKHYSECKYAITCKKKGWECLRHYEILLAGCIPFFIDIDNIPNNTMVKFPKKLVKDAMNIDGIPTQEEIKDAIKHNKPIPPINYNLFSIEKYNKLRSQLLEYTNNHLLSKYIDISTKSNVFLYSYIWGHNQDMMWIDYQRDLLVIGLLERGVKVYTNCNFSYLFTDYNGPTKHLYGKGFIITKSVPAKFKKNVNKLPYNDNDKDKDILVNKTTYIVTTLSNMCPPLTSSIPFDNNDIIFIDGNDIIGDHTIPKYCNRVYIREC